MSKQQCKILFSFFICCSISGCASFIEALFGTSTDLNTGDTTPPTIQIVVADVYVRDPASGDFVVTNEDRVAYVHATPIRFYAFGDDPDGLHFAEVLDMTLIPYCGVIIERDDGRPPAPPTFLASEAIVIPVLRLENSATSSVITTRIPVIHHVTLSHDFSGYCPDDRPLVGHLLVRIRARAGNFGGQVTETATATLITGAIPSGLVGRTPRACPAGTRHDGAGHCVPG